MANKGEEMNSCEGCKWEEGGKFTIDGYRPHYLGCSRCSRQVGRTDLYRPFDKGLTELGYSNPEEFPKPELPERIDGFPPKPLEDWVSDLRKAFNDLRDWGKGIEERLKK